MFKIKNAAGEEVHVNEIYEEGFNLTMEMFKNKQIGRNKRDIIGSYITSSKNMNNIVIPTGISSLDNVLGGGLQAGLYVIGANPGTGKTSLTLHILSNLAQAGYSSVFFSLDMSNVQTSIRLMSNVSCKFPELDNFNINALSNLKQIFVDEEYKKKFFDLYKTYMTNFDCYINVLSLYQDVSGKINDDITYVESVEVVLKNYQRYFKCSPVIVIDYLQLMKTKSEFSFEDDNDMNLKSNGKRIEINSILDKLKMYSTNYNVPIIVITTSNRSSYSKSNDYNQDLYDIGFCKESGDIEYRADVLFRLTSDKNLNNLGNSQQKLINLSIVKSRFGKDHFTIPLKFLPEYTYFSESIKD